ncbi:MAG: hypothetical protein JXA67_18480 [Micromonosporaceae bacterium]|nr:hypothetical protein [Micromonosporaceae bacterium]
MRTKTTLLAVGTMIIASVAAIIPTASPAFAASCPDNGWSIKDGRYGQYFASNGINIRTGPSTACTSLGLGYSSYSVMLDCYKSGQNGTWSHLWVENTGVQGWVKDSLLVGGGANTYC